MRLIDADALKLAIRAEQWKQERKVQLTLDFIDIIIDEQPTVDFQKKGIWLNWQGEPVLPNEFYRWWHCSECDYKMEFDEAITADQFDSNFCPRCGAKMDGDGNG